MSRNVEFLGGTSGGAWSLVFVGCRGNPPEYDGTGGGPSVTADDDPETKVAEKPFVTSDDGARYYLQVPAVRGGGGPSSSSGADHGGDGDERRDFSRVRVAVAGRDGHASLQDALDAGKDLVLSPGIYDLGKTLVVGRPGQVVLGLGLATILAPPDGSPCVRVEPYVPGVRVAGLLLEASALPPSASKRGPSALLVWGSEDAARDPGRPEDLGVLSDIFARVGGAATDRAVSADAMVEIRSGNVVGDNLWLWRADHSALREGERPTDPAKSEYHLVQEGEFPCATGLVVTGDDVTVHGLAVEHVVGDGVVWSGERGTVRFYQSEFPYDVSPETFGDPPGTAVGYRVEEHVTSHDAAGLGVYSYFRDYNVDVRTAVVHPPSPPDAGGGIGGSGNVGDGGGGTVDGDEEPPRGRHGIVLRNIFTVLLDGLGSIGSVVNGRGDPVQNQGDLSRVAVSPPRTP
mmetsp:Transcript_36599/g.85538  ORF Transcript_36599/g.85538 Transcript_36599/m.85538 type:complete len:459 (-) Transcript_36599:64-1440(-)